MTAKTKGAVVAGFAGAAAYTAVHALFHWSALYHADWHQRLVELGWMAIDAALAVITYVVTMRLIFRRFGYQANTSKSER